MHCSSIEHFHSGKPREKLRKNYGKHCNEFDRLLLSINQNFSVSPDVVALKNMGRRRECSYRWHPSRDERKSTNDYVNQKKKGDSFTVRFLFSQDQELLKQKAGKSFAASDEDYSWEIDP